MTNSVTRGLAAGALGTMALEITTYLDMALRGRPASQMPAKTVGKVVDEVSETVTGAPAGTSSDRATTSNRRSGAGALLGYAVGIGIGAAYGVVRSRVRRVPLPAMAVATAVSAMAAGDLPPIATGATKPGEWGVAGWISDIVPHLAYGAITALSFDWISEQTTSRSRLVLESLPLVNTLTSIPAAVGQALQDDVISRLPGPR